MKEIWKDVVGYEGLYQVSDLGQVRSLNYNKTGKVKVLSPAINNRGYCHVILCKDRKKKDFLVHRLVVTAFIGPIAKGRQVNHKNENKLDNRLSNLEVVTAKENTNHGTRNERIAKALSRPLVLIPYERPDDKLYFSSSLEAGAYFDFKHSRQVISYISAARRAGRNCINIKGKNYVFEIVG